MTRKAKPMALAMLFAFAIPAVAQTATADAEAEIRSLPMVVDMLYQPGMTVEWIIGVQDDGTRRYGLAQSICETLKQHGAADAGTVVRIVDVATFMSTRGDHRKASLGSVACETYERREP